MGVSVTLDVVGRKWSGFVCPECRFVFRVPRDHDGKGVKCPSCSRLLRLPGDGDDVGRLVAGVKGHMLVDGVKVKRRHSSSRKEAVETGWEKPTARSSSSETAGKGTSRWLPVVAGAAVIALAGTGLWFFTRTPQELPPTAAPPLATHLPPAPDVGEPPTAEEPVAVPVEEPAELLIAEAGKAAESFLAAGNVDDLLAASRPRPGLREKMELWYGTKGVPNEKMRSLVPSSLRREGDCRLAVVRMDDDEERTMIFQKTGDGLKVDWESWVGWSSMTWEDFLKRKPTQETEFRIYANPTNYYNYDFTDETKWISFRLDAPTGEKWIYGYAPAGSEIASQMAAAVRSGRIPYTLMLKFPADSKAPNQVIISKIVAGGWMVKDAPTEP